MGWRLTASALFLWFTGETRVVGLWAVNYNARMFAGQPLTVENYTKADGTEPITEWLENLRDVMAETRLAARFRRLALGNPGDYKSVGDGVYELRVDYGPGYRVYFAFSDTRIVILLCGGTKKTQQADIATARQYWKEFQQRSTS